MRLQPSRMLIALITALYLGAVICLGFISIAWAFKLLLILGIGLHYYYIARRYLFLSSDTAIVKIIWLEATEWKLIQKNGAIIYTNLQGDSFLSSHLAILNFIAEDKNKLSVVIGAGGLMQHDFRLLKMRILTC